jgi:plastocyanin
MTSSRRAFALVAAVAIATACSSPAAPAATSAPPAASVNIDVQGFKFPPNMDVAAGTKVTWTNKDSVAHTVTSGTRPNKDGKFDGQLAANGTFSFTFTAAGTYQYFCTVHSSMNGTITVK